jgi:Uma2 family endonuclease
MAIKGEATVDDLYRVEGKAEIVDGEIVLMSAAGGLHGYAAGVIYASLLEYARRTKSGYALPDNVGFVVDLPRRRSFSPDAAFTRRALTRKFIDGAPVFAAEVRSDEDFGPAAELAMARKRADYFAAGTLVVWDVDTLEDHVVRVFRVSDPANPAIYRRGERAEAEPALPGWSMPVDDVFPQ